jgi:hypothetical protein
MSTVAVFVALGGGAYAMSANSVGTRQLKDNAVTSVKVKDGSLRGVDFAASELAKLKGAKGDAGVAGQPGAAGQVGPPGAAGTNATGGSPDTGAQILTKLVGVDGAGSGLDADTVDGISSDTLSHPTGAASGALAGTYPAPTLASLPHLLRSGGAATVETGRFVPLVTFSTTTASPGWGTPPTSGDPITVPATGWYHLTVNWAWDPDVDGWRALTIATGGPPIAEEEINAVDRPGDWTQQSVSATAYLTVGDEVDFEAFQANPEGDQLGCASASRCNVSVDYMP